MCDPPYASSAPFWEDKDSIKARVRSSGPDCTRQGLTGASFMLSPQSFLSRNKRTRLFRFISFQDVDEIDRELSDDPQFWVRFDLDTASAFSSL